MGSSTDRAMKRTQLLSVVLSLIMFTGVTAGSISAVQADSEDLEDKLEDFCEMTSDEQSDFLSENSDIAQYENRLGEICDITDEDEREDAMEDLIDEILPEARDDYDDIDENETDEETEDESNDYDYDHPSDKRYENSDKAKHHVDDDYLEDMLEDFCELSDQEKDAFFDKHQRLGEFEDRIREYCDLPEDEREDAIDDFIEEHYENKSDSYHHDYKDYDDKLEDKLERYCDMSNEDREKFVTMHDKEDEHVAKMNEYCDLTEDEREDFVDELEEEYEMKHAQDMQAMLESYCEMSEDDRASFLAENDKATEHADKMNEYCELDDQGKEDFIEEHLDEYISHVKHAKMYDNKKDHKMLVSKMQQKHKDVRDHKKYEKYCEMSGAERAEAIDDLGKLERISEWCEMTPEERDELEMTHHDVAMDFKEKHHEEHDKKMMMLKKYDLSPRLKEMIMTKYDISDEKLEEIKMKYHEKYGEMSDEKKSEITLKYKNYMSSHGQKISDEHKTAIHERIAEMKSFKEKLRSMDSDMTDEQKQEFREEFIQQANELHLAWISPRVQVDAGLDVADIQCREGYTLVLKESNGMPMCMTGDSALKMIDKGIAVLPAV